MIIRLCAYGDSSSIWLIGDSKGYLSGLPWTTHKCVSLFCQIFLALFGSAESSSRINVYPTSHLSGVLHFLTQ